MTAERRRDLARLALSLSDRQVDYLFQIAEVMRDPASTSINPASDFDPEWFSMFGEVLQLHHLHSVEPFTKDKFEYALVSTMKSCGHDAQKSSRGLPGQDVEIDGVPWSLKTQADRNIKRDQIHISKYMELGKGNWETEEDLEKLRSRMISHMESYERIFTLRCLTPEDEFQREYELLEIPKSLLLRSQDFPCRMNMTSRQNPKPGRCVVEDDTGRVLLELYFDGGSERKLQVQKIAVSECMFHSRWKFAIPHAS